MHTRQIIILISALVLTTTLAAQPVGRKAWDEGWSHNAKVLVLSQKDLQKDLQLEVDGASPQAKVLVNEEEAAGFLDEYGTLVANLTPLLVPGNNVIEITEGPHRAIWLTATGKTSVAHNGSHVTCKVEGDGAHGRQTFQMKTDRLQTVNLTTRIYYQEKLVAESHSSAPIYNGKEVVQVFDLADVRLWSPGSPNMYLSRTVVEASDGTRDTYELSFGIPAEGEWKVTGAVLPATAGPFGEDWNPEYWECRLSLLRKAGIDAVSCDGHLPAPDLLPLCDRAGLVMADIPALTLPRDASHPCVRYVSTRDFRPLADILDADGFPVARELRSTAPYRITASTAYNGPTLSLVQVEATDRSNNPTATPALTFEVTGPAEVVSAGKASALVRRSGPGAITVTVKAKGLRAATVITL